MATLQTLIAHYLATSYPSALPSFLSATGEAPPDLAHPPQPDLRTVAQDYLSAQLAKQFEGVGVNGKVEKAQDGSWAGWTARDVVGMKVARRELRVARTGAGTERTVEGLSAGNMLSVGKGEVPRRWFDTSTARTEIRTSLLVTSVDKTLSIVDYETGEVSSIREPHRSSVLSFALHPTKPRYLLTGAMDGTTILTDLITSRPVQTFRSSKFVVRVAFSPCGRYMATASYDKHVVLYRIYAGGDEGMRAAARQRARRGVGRQHQDGDEDMEGVPGAVNEGSTEDDEEEDELDLLDDTDDPTLACEPGLRYEEVHRIKVDHNPEAILFVPPTPAPVLPNSSLSSANPEAGSQGWLLYTTRSSHLLNYLCPLTLTPRTKSFNAHPLDTHVSFSVLNMVLHPSGRVVACQTGDSMAGERILLYDADPDEPERLACIWTGAETDDYVLPRMAFTSDGSALITTSPNGYLHLLPLSGGMSSLKVHGNSNSANGAMRGAVGGGGGEIIRDVCVVGTTAVSVGYDRVVRFTEFVDA